MKEAVLLIAHGTVDDLADLPAFVRNIRRGHEPSPELVAELRRRYEAIGGSSPLLGITRSVTAKLEARLGVPVRMAMRLWRPYPKDVLAELGADRVVVLALAQHSASVYVEAVKEVAPPGTEIVAVPNWGQDPALVEAFAEKVRGAVRSWSDAERNDTALVLSAHSLPKAIVDAGDPYEREARGAADAVAARVRDVLPDARIAFQSQGMSTGPGGRPVVWLGPDLPATFDAIAAEGRHRVLVAPIGFLADHVEVLYDLDIEAKAQAEARGLRLFRTESLNDDDAFVSVLAGLVHPLLQGGPS
jgi:ferrochelatase